jgi:membrane-associated phospholipid phosphatase
MDIDAYFVRGLDYIGLYSYIILFWFSIFLFLVPKMKIRYLSFYLVFCYINYFLVTLIKNTIREPRPKLAPFFIDEHLTGDHLYGMPSAHAASVFYTISFLYFAGVLTYKRLWFCAFVAAAMYYQRWFYKRHTAAQLIAGTVLGAGTGYLAVYCAKKFGDGGWGAPEAAAAATHKNTNI